MSFEFLLKIINKQLVKTQECPLNKVETLLLQGIYQDVTYHEIGQKEDYSVGYLSNVAAPKLYKKLSNLLGKNVTKKGCRPLLENYVFSLESNPSFFHPSGAVPLDSPFYIERPPLEEQGYEAVSQPGALIRIKAPKEMGKTSLLLRILESAIAKEYQTVTLNFAQIDRAILRDLGRFLRFLCASCSQQLGLESKLEEYWDDDIGHKVSCSMYFRCYLLEQLKTPIVLAFDELDLIFEYPQVAKDVFSLLRSWYEDARRTPSWQNLRLIVVYSTEVYIPLPTYQSPFNVGFPIELKSFNPEQVIKLAKKYQLNWQNNEEAEQLIDLVGGHPGLIQITLYHLNQQEITFSQLLQTASTPEGVYYRHLRRQWLKLKQQPKLAQIFNTIVTTSESFPLNSIIADRLIGMGLVKRLNNKLAVSCQLYQSFFTKYPVEIDRTASFNLDFEYLDGRYEHPR